ncbi:MAG TPA: prepilin-type N-terminal cleavage/methylation domain-containing protein [Pirellulales bacterium]|jgi:type II secretory pathway pseudopilin PulG|nr:prepilin-type N-terminal cleavage/methylation domain-containing protein [Pirellulales bacterium]
MCKHAWGAGRGARDAGRGGLTGARSSLAVSRVEDSPFGFRRHSAFTLVEMMVVIVIIMILVGLLTPVLVNVMARAREARITAEIAALDGSMKAYKEKYGSYPPSDFSSTGMPLVIAHLAHAFPHCNANTEAAAIPSGLTAAQALVFWLSGFSPDPEHPITGQGAKTALYQFDTTRLQPAGAAAPVYVPTDGLGSPYVYFAAQNYATQAAYNTVSANQGGTGVCRPYYLDTGSSTVSPQLLYANPNTFQIISAGLDGDFGDTSASSTPSPYPSYPSGNGYTQGDLDNLTNFAPSNLKDSTPH